MIPFDIKLLTVQFVQLKTVTLALGGAITVVDNDRSTASKEVYSRVDVPFAIVRKFQKQHKISRYLRPVWTAVIRYGDLVVALERHPLGAAGEIDEERFDGQVRRWEPFCEISIRRVIAEKIKKHNDWWFDGRFMYRFPRGIINAVTTGRFLSQDGQFRAVECTAIDFADLELQSQLEQEVTRTCVAFIANTGDFALTPPVWKTFDITGRTTNADSNDKRRQRFDFDEFDSQMALNINFALKAGTDLADVFGHEIIEPLELPDLMIRMKTVNLPSITMEVKSTTPIHLTFKNAIAWIIGLLARADTLDAYLTLRNLLKYMISKGVVRKDALDSVRVFKDLDNTAIPLLTRDQAQENAAKAIANITPGVPLFGTGQTRRRAGSSVIGNMVFNEDGTVD